MDEYFHCSTSSTAWATICLLTLSILMGVRWYLTVVFPDQRCLWVSRKWVVQLGSEIKQWVEEGHLGGEDLCDPLKIGTGVKGGCSSLLQSWGWDKDIGFGGAGGETKIYISDLCVPAGVEGWNKTMTERKFWRSTVSISTSLSEIMNVYIKCLFVLHC